MSATETRPAFAVTATEMPVTTNGIAVEMVRVTRLYRTKAAAANYAKRASYMYRSGDEIVVEKVRTAPFDSNGVILTSVPRAGEIDLRNAPAASIVVGL
jgi:hypothetical protein